MKVSVKIQRGRNTDQRGEGTPGRAVNKPSQSFKVPEKASIRVFSLLKEL